MKLRRSHFMIAALVVVIGVVWVRGFWFTEVFRTHKNNEANRTALLRVYEAVNVGASQEDVLTAYWQHRTYDLRLRAETAAWFIRMPLEFGASDWTLDIEFQDGKVSALRVRTSDGPPLKDGPKDKQTNAG